MTDPGLATGWPEMGLDPRLLRALAKRGFAVPTAVQAAAVPRCLEGKDVLARARTGSGKTLAYVLPALHRLLAADVGVPSADADISQQRDSAALAALQGSFQVLVLVPTWELCEQVTALLGENNQQLKRSVATAGHFVVATPGKVAAALREGYLPPGALAARLRCMVLDEADLLLSYGYEEDLQLLAPLVPRSCQCMLMSATSSGDVERLQKLVLHNPLALNLLDAGAAAGTAGLASGLGVSAQVAHFAIDCSKEDRLLHVMAMLKLGLVRKKVLLFVNTVDEAFRLKLFLESFGISAALLNAELPLNSRSHILQTFNKGLFDYLIATDDVHAAARDGTKSVTQVKKKGRKAAAAAVMADTRPAKRQRKDEEFGVTRGIDFKGVRTIINYDVPSSVQGYVHRVGRTGRGGEAGIAISLFTAADAELRQEVQAALEEAAGPVVGQPVAPAAAVRVDDGADGEPSTSGQGEAGAAGGSDDEEDGDDVARARRQVLRPFTRLSKVQVEALRYRAEDMARAITRHIIKEARARELKAELLNSSKLKDYFEGHTAEQQLLRHDKPLHRQPQAAHLRHVPGYLKDPATVGVASSKVGNFKAKVQAKTPRNGSNKRKRADGVVGGAGVDPLKAVGGAPTHGANGTSAGHNGLAALKPKGFAKAPKRGGGEELTEMEKRAAAKGRKQAKARLKAAGGPAPTAVYKQNVNKRGGVIRRR